MSEKQAGQDRSFDDVELRSIVAAMLRRCSDSKRHVTRMERRLSDFRSSFTLDELDVWLDDGSAHQLMLKNLSWEALLPEARHVKPAVFYNPLREIAVYQNILARRRFGVPTCYGAVVDPQKRRYWLVLERVRGLRLVHVGDFDIWLDTARWLAGLHSHFTGQAGLLAQAAPLVHYDGDLFRLWIGRAKQFTQGHAARQRCVAWLAARYDQVVTRLMALPVTFIHGEFFAPNVLVSYTADGVRLCPVDWEIAAVGSGLIDLAALTTGAWSEEKRLAMAMAYYNALPERSELRLPLEAFLDAVDCCHLHLAVQWLGWSPDWAPPVEQENDWLSEAMRLAERLGL